MAIRQHRSSGGSFGVALVASAVIHLAVFLLLLWSGRLFPPTTPVQETYYVDVVNLPVASPRSGSPTERGSGAEAPPSPVQPEREMTLPAPQKKEISSVAPSAKPTPQKSKASAESDAFAERMAKLQGKAEARQQEAVIDRLRRNVAGSGPGGGRAGMPGGMGSEAGSRYEDYIKSRLEDALKKTSAFSTRNPVVVIRLTIGVNGTISRQKMERSSGDVMFERAVQRAIELAAQTFPPPPNQRPFENGFIFKPRAISNTNP